MVGKNGKLNETIEVSALWSIPPIWRPMTNMMALPCSGMIHIGEPTRTRGSSGQLSSDLHLQLTVTRTPSRALGTTRVRLGVEDWTHPIGGSVIVVATTHTFIPPPPGAIYIHITREDTAKHALPVASP